MSHPNPNGANDTTQDPRQQVCWDFYVEGLAHGRENAYESAIRAGYEETSAKTITVTRWFLDRKARLKRKDIFSKAEKILDKTLSYETEDADGKPKIDLLRAQLDAAKHVTSTLGKDEGYSSRQENTGKDGVPLIPETNKELDALIAQKVEEELKHGNKTSD